MSSEVKKKVECQSQKVMLSYGWGGGGRSMEPPEAQLGPNLWREGILFPNLKGKLCHFELQLIGTQWRKTSEGDHFFPISTSKKFL